MTVTRPISAEPAHSATERWGTVVAAGLLAGALDLAFALIFYSFQGATPAGILRGIASGILVRDAAHAAGSGPVVLGACLHFFIAVCASLVFFLTSRRFPQLARRPLPSGAVFGVAVYLFMHLVVIQLSRIPFRMPSLHNIVGELCSHIFLFGIVIALGTARASRTRSP